MLYTCSIISSIIGDQKHKRNYARIIGQVMSIIILPANYKFTYYYKDFICTVSTSTVQSLQMSRDILALE